MVNKGDKTILLDDTVALSSGSVSESDKVVVYSKEHGRGPSIERGGEWNPTFDVGDPCVLVTEQLAQANVVVHAE
jgi:hypothetical protein